MLCPVGLTGDDKGLRVEPHPRRPPVRLLTFARHVVPAAARLESNRSSYAVLAEVDGPGSSRPEAMSLTTALVRTPCVRHNGLRGGCRYPRYPAHMKLPTDERLGLWMQYLIFSRKAINSAARTIDQTVRRNP